MSRTPRTLPTSQAGPDLMLETLVIDESKPYHRLFSPATVKIARDRMADYRDRHSS